MLHRTNCHLSVATSLRTTHDISGSHKVHMKACKHVAKFFVHNTAFNILSILQNGALKFQKRIFVQMTKHLKEDRLTETYKEQNIRGFCG